MSQPTLTPGFRFKNNTLYIFTTGNIMLIRGFPEPTAVQKKDSAEGWSPFEPTFRLVKPYRPSRRKTRKASAQPAQSENTKQTTLFQPTLFEVADDTPALKSKPPPLKDQRKKAFDSFRFSLPKEVAACLEGYQAHQWAPLLLMAQGGKPALDLFRSNPVLGFALAHCDRLRGQKQHGITKAALIMVGEKQRDILDWLGFPGSKSAVKVLRKTVPQAINPENVRGLRGALASEDSCKLLSHLRCINAGVLGLVCNDRIQEYITPKLLEEVAAQRSQTYRAFTAGLVSHTCEMVLKMRPGAKLPSFTSIAQVEKQHDLIAADYCEWQRFLKKKGFFPPPPIPGTQTILPIIAPIDLREEGSKQHNCVASYADRVAEGKIYMYRVIHPERATLSIVRGPGGDWEIDQLKAACNRSVQLKTRRAVRDWLGSYSYSA